MSAFRRVTRQNLPLDLIALRGSARGGAGYAAPTPGGQAVGSLPSLSEPDQPPSFGGAGLTPEQFEKLLTALWHRGNLLIQPFIATDTEPLSLRPQEIRYYCFIQNQSLVNQLSVNFGKPAGAPGVVPTDGIVIAPNFGFYEPLMVPQDSISVRASGVNTPGIIIYSTIQI